MPGYITDVYMHLYILYIVNYNPVRCSKYKGNKLMQHPDQVEFSLQGYSRSTYGKPAVVFEGYTSLISFVCQFMKI